MHTHSNRATNKMALQYEIIVIEVFRGPPSGLQISNTRGPQLTWARQLSTVDTLRAVYNLSIV